MPKFAAYHWADGKSIRLGLTPCESVYTLGLPWSIHKSGYKPSNKNIHAYIFTESGVRKATYWTGGENYGWQHMDFDEGTSLEDAQAAIETILKLED